MPAPYVPEDDEVCRKIFRKRASIEVGDTDPFEDYATTFYVDGTKYWIKRNYFNGHTSLFTKTGRRGYVSFSTPIHTCSTPCLMWLMRSRPNRMSATRGGRSMPSSTEIPDSTDLVERLRTALIECGRAAGGGLSDDVSNEFLMFVPAEVRSKITQQADTIRELREAKEQAERNRDMWKGQCERQAVSLASKREALKPFAALADEFHPATRGDQPGVMTDLFHQGDLEHFTINDFRRARTALKDTK